MGLTRKRGAPRLSVGLPVYNGEKFLGQAFEALLGQTYEDLELIVSDNASTDGSAEICHDYAARDRRVRYIRQPHNIGLIPNHVFVMEQARGELFKCAAHDDLYARELLAHCVEALDEDPGAVLAHAWSAMIDTSGDVIGTFGRGPAIDSPEPSERFRKVLFDGCHDYEYGVIRTAALRRMKRQNSYHQAERTFNAELALNGRFQLVPEWLYFRREHPGEPPRTVRERCGVLDPRRTDRLRHPVARLYAEYLWGYVAGIRQAPLSAAERRKCYSTLFQWMAARAAPVACRALSHEPLGEDPLSEVPFIAVDAVVAGRRPS
jgi:glycosyltransferase involved in cell wall biosynthesis